MSRIRLLLPGATLADRLLACFGAFAGIAATALLGRLAGVAAAVLVAPMGASAVLVFAVPASPLAQPWPVVGGNALSALVGIAAATLLGHGALAAGVAVAAAILVMSASRCLHPPGGAAALLPVIGGPAVAAAGWRFAFLPVAADALMLVAAGWLFHRVSGHVWPHRAAALVAPPRFLPEDLDVALAQAGEAFDIDRNDLMQLLVAAEAAADRRVASR